MRARTDDDAYKIRFTPHKRSLAWSAINFELAAVAPQEKALFRRNKVAWKFFKPKRRSEREALPTMIFSSVPTLYGS